ncbi:MAG: hypothetical protein IK046_01530, partial [Clostridia bacterium]|nr:hypothetical protein [Clostridia bacterium]
MADEKQKKLTREEKRELRKAEKRPLSGIARRWVFNTFLIVAIILLLFAVMFLIVIQRFYMSTVTNKLSAQYSNSVANYFSQYIGGTSDRFETGAREYIQNFQQKDIMEVWVIDEDGRVVASSSGFSVEKQTIPDYEAALKSDTRTATYTGTNPYGES